MSVFVLLAVMRSHSTPEAKYDLELGRLGAKLAVSADETEAAVAVVEHTLAPRSLAAPLHRHSREDEISYVLAGEMTVLAGDERSTVTAGEFAVKGRDTWHTFWNAGDEPLRFLEIIAPGEFAGLFAEVAELFPLDPTDEEKMAGYQAINERYGFEVDFESVPRLCEEHGLRM
jgi:mannose-6-phosphate isomerase-like protein (cupin superfamily)